MSYRPSLVSDTWKARGDCDRKAQQDRPAAQAAAPDASTIRATEARPQKCDKVQGSKTARQPARPTGVQPRPDDVKVRGRIKRCRLPAMLTAERPQSKRWVALECTKNAAHAKIAGSTTVDSEAKITARIQGRQTSRAMLPQSGVVKRKSTCADLGRRLPELSRFR